MGQSSFEIVYGHLHNLQRTDEPDEACAAVEALSLDLAEVRELARIVADILDEPMLSYTTTLK